jgi:hypothetical protein
VGKRSEGITASSTDSKTNALGSCETHHVRGSSQEDRSVPAGEVGEGEAAQKRAAWRCRLLMPGIRNRQWGGRKRPNSWCMRACAKPECAGVKPALADSCSRLTAAQFRALDLQKTMRHAGPMARRSALAIPADLRARLEAARLDLLALFRALDRMDLSAAEIPQRLIHQLFELDAIMGKPSGRSTNPPAV